MQASPLPNAYKYFCNEEPKAGLLVVFAVVVVEFAGWRLSAFPPPHFPIFSLARLLKRIQAIK